MIIVKLKIQMIDIDINTHIYIIQNNETKT